MSACFEPGAAVPSQKLMVIKQLTENGIPCGMYLLPVIPFITDTQEKLEESVSLAKQNGVDFIIFGGLTLKPGRQKDYFLNVLKNGYPGLLPDYNRLYKDSHWGEIRQDYSRIIHHRFFQIAKKHKMPVRIPHRFFAKILHPDDVVIVLLEHMDYLLKLNNRNSDLNYAAHSISQLQGSLCDWKEKLASIKGISPTAANCVMEILETGSSALYRDLIEYA